MKGIPNTERQRLGALLDHETQETVMAMIPQFSETEIGAPVPAPAEGPEELGLLVFNMERGVHLEELGDFLQDCPGVRPLDVVLANELDDGCVRSGGRNTARELAERFGWNYAYGLEFIELVNGEDPKGFHGNAVFSRWPIRRAWTVRLPEQYNWYFDRQRRIGGRCAVLAELDVGGRPLGVASIHLENRTHGEGRRLQLEAVLRAAEELLPGIPGVQGEQGMLNPDLPTAPADVLILPMTEDLSAAISLATLLRENGIRAQLHCEEKKFKQKIAYADKLGIPYVIFLGEDEISSGVVACKDMATGEQTKLEPAATVYRIKAGLAEREKGTVIQE